MNSNRSNRDKGQKKQFTRWFPLFLFFCSMIIYGLEIKTYGLYWDDLANSFFAADGGAFLVGRIVATARPALAPLFYLPYQLLGSNPIAWHLFNIFARWLMFFGFYALLNESFPDQKHLNQLSALFVLAYPGFRQLWIARIYPPIYLVFCLEFYSLILFARSFHAKKKQRLVFHAVSILLSFYCLNASEYIFGLEFLRPFIAFISLNSDFPGASKKAIARKITLHWAPYVLMLLTFIGLRSFVFQSSLYDVVETGNLIKTPLQTLRELVGFLSKSAFASVINVWGFLLKPAFWVELMWKRIFILIPLLCVTFFTLFNQRRMHHEDRTGKSDWIVFALTGLVSLLFAGVPFWAAGLTPSVNFPNDRFFLPYAFGASMLFSVLIYKLFRSPLVRNIIFSLFFMIGAAFHISNAQSFQQDWDDLQKTLNQIVWRVPSFREGTLLVAEELPLKYYSDNSLTGAINWLYAEDSVFPDLPIMLNYTTVRLGRSLPSLKPHTDIHQGYLLYNFQGSTDAMIVLFHHPPSCLHFADPSLDPLHPGLPDILKQSSTHSNLSRITSIECQNDLEFVRQVDESDWCYYYQKASLALQYEEYDEILRLGQIAFSRGFVPHDPSETIPFIFGYAYQGDWNRAVQLSLYTQSGNSAFDPMLCAVWNIIEDETMPDSQRSSALAAVHAALSCAARK